MTRSAPAGVTGGAAPIVMAITGVSGAPYGVRLLEQRVLAWHSSVRGEVIA